jgi:hypothetical protein
MLHEIPKYKTNVFKMSIERKGTDIKTIKELQTKWIKERIKNMEAKSGRTKSDRVNKRPDLPLLHGEDE